jgi:hypothetical protein
MTSFKRWLGAGAIVLVALALVACPALVPKATGSIPAMSFAHDDTDARTVALGSYFADSDDATFKAESSMPAVAAVSVTDATLTVTPGDAGTATVTVTATSSTGRDSDTQTFTVTVASPPDPPPPPVNNAPEMRTINNLSLDVGESMPVNLADYASDADGDTLLYGAQSLNPTVATVTPSSPDAMTPIAGSVITIEGVAGGEATIAVGVTDGKSALVTRTFVVVVTAPAPDNRAPVLLTSNLIPHITAADDFRIDDMMTYTLSEHFQDPDADTPITYDASSSDALIASVDEPDANGMFTLTAVGKGTARITVKATDPDGASAQQTFEVVVGSKPPKPTSASTDVDLKLVDGMVVSRTFDLDDYFEDDLGEALAYDIVDEKTTGAMYATAALPMDSSMLTIIAVAAGDATVTVSAKDSDNDPVELAFSVMVHAADVVVPGNNAPTLTASIDDMSLMAGETDDVDLSMHFEDADTDDMLTYTAMSSVPAIATAEVSGSTVTITAKVAGTTTVTVTATDESDASESDSFEVTVTEAPNMAPRPKAGMVLADYKVQIADGTDDDATNDTDAADTVDNRSFDLSTYFEDPDGILLFFKVETEDDEVIDLHSVPPDTVASPAVPASGSPPDGTDDDATMVIIEPLSAGTATVTVTVLDIDGDSYVHSFMVTVFAEGANTAPTLAGSPPAIADQAAAANTDNSRLKIGETRTIIDGANFNAHFTDPNFNIGNEAGDYLTFSVKYYPAGTAATVTAGVIPAGTAELDADKVGVTASLSATTWGGDPNAKLTLTITGTKGTDNTSATDTDHGHDVAIVATDTFGASVARLFRVEVNNAPEAEGAQASDPKTLGGESMYMDMGFNTDTTADAMHITLVEDVDAGVEGSGGYFHDPDVDDVLTCRINSSTGADYAAFTLQNQAGDTAEPRGLRIDPKKQGSASVTVACVDPFGVPSPADTLSVVVTHQSISRQ